MRWPVGPTVLFAVLFTIYGGLVLTKAQGDPIPLLRPYHGEPTIMVQTLVRQSNRARLAHTLMSVPPGGVIMATGQCPEGWVVYTDEDDSPLFFPLGVFVHRDGRDGEREGAQLLLVCRRAF